MSQPNYDFLDQCITTPTKPTKTAKPPNMKQSKKPIKPKLPAKPKPIVAVAVKPKSKTKSPKSNKTPTKPPVLPQSTPPQVKSATGGSNKKYVDSLATLNKEKLLDNNMFDSINAQKESNNQKPISLNSYSAIINNISKILLKSNIMLTDSLVDTLTDKFDTIVSSISGLSVNTQRKYLSDIITILNTDPDISQKNIVKYTAQRKKIQLKQK